MVRRFQPSLIGVLLAVILACASRSAVGEDRVELAPTKDGKPGATMRGEIVEIHGGQIRLKRADGREDVVPLARVARYHTAWPEGLEAGDRQRREGRFDEALESYRGAAARDMRAWVKRVLAARAVVCFRESERPLKAGELFLSLYQTDPETPHFEALPLAWSTTESTSELRNAATRWLSAQDSPAAVLLGASWLLAVGQPGSAVEPLRQLTTQRDPRIALLAEAQLWRVRLATAGESDVESWERIVPRLPSLLRAGPYFVLGQAWARFDQRERAALSLLRVPIEYPEHYRLASEALELAARQLDQLERRDEAARLRREQAARFPTGPKNPALDPSANR